MFLISPYAFATSTLLIDQITTLGLTSGLQLCLDAGDALSYTSGQTWADRSGNAYDFVRGSTSASQASDPTFNGVAGGSSSSEYWSFDGSDYFTLDQANPTWVNNVHKNNATVTLAAWVYLAGTSGTFCGDYTSSAGVPHFNWYPSSSNKLGVAIGKGSAPLALNEVTAATISTSAWSFVALALNEAANTMTMQINATQEAFACTYTSPSASNASNELRIGADGDGSFPLPNGSRIASLMAWNTKLSDSDLLALYNATKTKFGL